MTLTGIEQLSDTNRRRIESLHPAIRQDAVNACLEARQLGIEIQITYGLRTFAEQDRLFAKGRTAPGAIVTHARGGQSYHNYGLALDFALKHADGSVSFNVHEDMNADGKADWDQVVEIFKRHGFDWGGDFKNIKDRPHVEKRFGLHWSDMQSAVVGGLVDDAGYVRLTA